MKPKAKVIKEKPRGKITTWATAEEFGAKLDLETFIRNCCERVGSPAFLFSNTAMTGKFIEAMHAEVLLMKKAAGGVA